MDTTCPVYRGLQIHPTRRCNLRCQHCYSSSGPEERGALSAALLQDAITDASQEGYTLANFSGGEPLLYPALPVLLHHAHQCGMVTTVTSNGMLLDERRLERLKGGTDVLAISLDGVPASHNRMRGSERAFEVMAGRLEAVRQSGIPFGFIFTLTQYNLDELDWVADFAMEQRARLLQIHPLEEVGRASRLLSGSRPDDVESACAYLVVSRLRKRVGDRLYVQLDFLDRDLLRAHPEYAFAGECPGADSEPALADLVSPLVIEADATVVPIGYGFARRYSLGSLHTARLRELAAAWRREQYGAFRDLCRRVFEELTSPHDLPFTNWYELIQLRAETGASVPPTH
jgi:MoaA/NifB/PqqE/SkfB family radical SAM enzyme